MTELTKFKNLSVDTTLGGNNASDETISSQKAIKHYIDLGLNAKANASEIVQADNITIKNVNRIISAPLASIDFINNSKGMETGAICSDKRIYQDVLGYAHSTFDLSKFTVVGVPTISADGILTTTSSNQYVTGSNFSFTNGFQLKGKFTGQIGNINSCPLLITNSHASGADKAFAIKVTASGIRVGIADFDGTSYISGTVPQISGNALGITDNNPHTIYYDISIKGTTVTFKAKVEGGSWQTATGTLTGNYALSNVHICAGGNTWGSATTLVTDLKYTEWYIDDVLVFSGNKTGIDTIKPDDYSVVDTPTITDDGIANITSTNGIATQYIISADNSDWEFGCRIKFNNFGSGTNFIEAMTLDNSKTVFSHYVSSSGAAIRMYVDVSGAQTSVGFTGNQPSYALGKWYDIYYKRVGNVFTFAYKLATDSTFTTFRQVYEGNYPVFNANIRFLEITSSSGLDYDVDLNSVYFVNKGSLVYQSCLKIPYVESRTGSKVVPVYARPRVIDAYEQGYPQRYYTIDEVNENYTLPIGEIYGMIETVPERKKDYISSLPAVQNEGNIVYNEKGVYERLEEDSHSTFDKSKFTIVGTVDITDDGIAGEFDSSSYLKTNTPIPIDRDFILTVEYIITQDFLTQYNSTKQYIIGGTYNPDNDIVPILLEHQNLANRNMKFTVTTNDNSSNPAFALISDHFDVAVNDIIRAELIRSVSDGYYKARFYKNGVKIGNDIIQSNSNNVAFASNIILGRFKNNYADQPLKGFIDLKQFSITVDGIPVFSGNKTGLDIIKPDDYTVVGTPTISADGIANGFSNNDYMYIDVSASVFSSASTWKVYTKILYTGISSNSVWSTLAGFGNTCWMLGLKNDTGTVSLYLSHDGTAQPTAKCSIALLATNKFYIIEAEFTGSKYILSVFNEDGTLFNKAEYDSSESVYNTGGTHINIIGNSTANDVIIEDLNAFKIYVDGNLVYQPCLKIPYTDSKDGKKIVDSVYKNRVESMYEQFGYAPYVTLNEVDKTYTLPMGSIYGLIGTRTLRDSYRNGINYWELYSDRTLEQGGSCTSGTAVTFIKPFADTNYVLTVPYSAKTTTGFTPSQTGDWIAKGTGNL